MNYYTIYIWNNMRRSLSNSANGQNHFNFLDIIYNFKRSRQVHALSKHTLAKLASLIMVEPSISNRWRSNKSAFMNNLVGSTNFLHIPLTSRLIEL